MKPLCLLSFVLVGSIVSAETILVLSRPEPRHIEAPACVANVEDGVMDVLFQADHIVYNDGAGGESALEPAIRRAREGGAGLLLLLTVRVSKPDDGPALLDAVAYNLYRVKDSWSLGQGELAPEKPQGKEETLEAFSLAVGRRVGASIKSLVRPTR